MRAPSIRLCFQLICCLFMVSSVNAQNYQQLWDHINHNERDEAKTMIEAKLKNNTASVDEFITYNFLLEFDGREDQIKDFATRIKKSENPDAYIYALWFTPAVADGYGFKQPHQIALLNQLIEANPGNGTLKASAHYGLGYHYASTHKFAEMKKENAKIGALDNWQFVGPFNNISGSGFNKNYDPVKYASNDSVFRSTENAPIKWFTPIEKPREGWVFASHYISESSGAITFAQTFVKSETAQDVYLASGFSGNIKVWVNDELLISVPEERNTELDAYTSKAHLNAGYNRILVQVGSDDDEPNFAVRITDKNFDPIANITSSAAPQEYKHVGGVASDNMVPLAAEVWFQNKIKSEPNNLINYIMLNRVYLRSKKVFEARKTIEKAIQLEPNNSLLKFELSLCYIKENNRTGLSELLEYFKESDKQSLFSYILRTDELKDQEKYQDALDTLEERERRYGSDESTYEEKIQLLNKLNKVPELVKLASEANKKFPRDPRFLRYAFNIEKSINKNPKKALQVLEEYEANNFNYEIHKMLIKEYFAQSNNKKPYQLMQELIDARPNYPQFRIDLMNEYNDQQRYPEAYELIKFMLKMKPYSGYFYDDLASVEESMKNNTDAITSYQTALTYQPTLYRSRDKQRKLQEKKSLFEVPPQNKMEDLIKATGKNITTAEYDYYFIQNEQTVVMYPEGGREEEYIVGIKVLNQRGIDHYKETSIGYNGNNEALIIEDAQLIKANGKKMKPEVSDNQIVWTSLEVNDVIYVKYKKKSYTRGKFAREFYDKFDFEGYNPVELARYTLIIPNDRKIHFEVINGSVEPKVSAFENYKVYTWEKSSSVGIKSEPYMPEASDFCATLHLSTLDSWNDIANWYSDVVYSKIATDNDYEVTEVYHKLFDGKTGLTAEQKAKTIYEYICKNINYSSVSFRQSAIVPQKASKTINTKLGDCKDISTLFVSLANLCGLKANLVLVSTRDNGKLDMLLPSFLFNHCIVKYYDEKNLEYTLELTDRDLPFKSLPSTLFQANALTIPTKDNSNKGNYLLQPLSGERKTADKVITNAKIEIEGNAMNISYVTTKTGNLSSGLRSNYKSLSVDNTLKEMQEDISKRFNNPVKVSSVNFSRLDTLLDSISVNVKLNVINEVKKIGAQSVFTVPYIDLLYTSSPFSLDSRKYDFEYWNYENADVYETHTEINLPADKMLVDVPQNQHLVFNGITYDISYTKATPNKLIVARKVQINRNNITPKDYAAFKSFVSKIVDNEGSYVTFK